MRYYFNPNKFLNLLIICGLFCSPYAISQNLVPNPSFETGSAPFPGDDKLGDHCSNWWDTYITPDYKGPTHTDFLAVLQAAGGQCGSGLNNSYGCGIAQDGSKCIGLLAVKAGNAEWAECILTSPMVAGEDYDISYYCQTTYSTGNAAANFVSHLGAYFLVGNYSGANPNTLPWNASMDWVENTAVLNTNVWQQYSWTMTASAANTNMIIGHMRTPADWSTTGNAGSFTGGYWVDNVVVSLVTVLADDELEIVGKVLENDKVEISCTSFDFGPGQEYELYRSVNGGKNFVVINAKSNENYDGLTFIDDLPEVEQIYYKVKLIREDGSRGFSPSVKIVNPSFNNESLSWRVISVNNEEIHLNLLLKNSGNVTCEIRDLGGRLIKTKHFDSNEGYSEVSLPVSGLSKGVYLISVNNSGFKKILIGE